MPETMPRPSTRKPLTLPRSFSRVLGRLLTLPAAESLPLANSVYAQTSDPAQRALALRLRLRLLQEALEAPRKPTPPIKAEPEPLPPPHAGARAGTRTTAETGQDPQTGESRSGGRGAFLDDERIGWQRG